MSEVMLRIYCDEIEELIDQESFDAAISHCQHVLKVHPKYLRVYGLMGKAALEKGELEAAADLFSRVLSMDPEDFVARVGMSIASEKGGTLEQAVWHMERAFELAPDNQAVVGELRRLYRRKDGVEPDKIPLTQGALARLYARGNLHTQAINEFRRLLEIEPNRVDLQVALAETLWQADQRIDAAETSLAILEKLPYCLKANLILGEIWSSSGREEESAVHLKRAQMIDPQNETAQVLFGGRSPLPPVEVRIGRMEYVAPPVPVEEEPDWLAAIVEKGTSPAAPDEAVPDWLQAVAASADIEAVPQEDTVTPEPTHVPDWLRAVAATAEAEAEGLAAEPEAEAPSPAESEMPDWLAGLTAEPADAVVEPLAPAEIPGWLEEAAPVAAEEPEAAPADMPDWLAEMAPPEAAPPPAEEPEVAPADMPDWLAEMAPPEAAPPPAEEPEVAPVDMPDWLAEMAPPEAAPPLAEEPEVAPADMPDWLAEMAPAEAAPPPAEEPEAAPADMPDWLAEMAPAEEELPSVEEAGLAPAELPDWLAEMAPPEAAPSAVTELDLAPAEVPDWLAEAEPVEEEAEVAALPLVAAETPDWLAELVEAAGASMEEPLAEQPAEPEEEQVLDWLTEPREEQVPEAEAPTGPVVIEEPEKEKLVYPEGAGGEVTEAEADLMARLEEMSPEEAFAAWEAMLAEGEAEEVTAPVPEAELPEEPEPAGPVVIEEPEEVTEAEADLMARLEEMSPEEAFAAWEAMLAEGEAEEVAAPMPEAALPEEPEPIGPVVIEEPEKEKLVYPEGAGGEVTEAEADLMARLEEMSPEEAFAAWEAMLAEGEVVEAEAPTVEPFVEEAPPPEPVAELSQAWMALAEDEGLEEVAAPAVAEEALPSFEPMETVVEAEVEAEAAPEEIAPELPAWAVTRAAETILEVAPGLEEEVAMGPDWVLLSQEQEVEVKTLEGPEPVVSPDLGEPIEEAVPVAEVPPPEPEPPAPPTWVALEEEPVAEAPVLEALTMDERVAEAKQRVAADRDDDQARLELARSLWAAGRKEQARIEYERLIKSPLRDEVIADLEQITTDAPREWPTFRLLGDAYMKDNRLQEALVTYRRALASL